MKFITKRKVFTSLCFLFLSLFFVSGISYGVILSSGNLENTGSTVSTPISLSQNLLNQKTSLETVLATTYNTIYNKYQTEIFPLLATSNYNSLKCMNLLTNDNILSDMDQEIEIIRKSILEQYVSLNAEIFNLMNQYAVGLISDVVYNAQKTSLDLEISNYLSLNKELLEQFVVKYNQKILSLKTEVNSFVSQNNDLLKKLNEKIITIQEIFKQETILQEGIFKINDLMDVGSSGFIQEIDNLRTFSIEILKSKLTDISNLYLYEYSRTTQEKNIIEQQKTEILDRFAYDLDKQIDGLFGKWYDRKTYDEIQHQIKILKDMFYENGEMMCDKVLSTQLDLDGYVKTVSNQVQNMIISLDGGINVLGNTGASTSLKNEILTSFKGFYTDRISKDELLFKNFVKNNVEKYSQEYQKQQQEKIKNIVHQWQNIVFSEAYEKNQSSEKVKALQWMLKKINFYNGDINGVYNQETIDAVYKLQLDGDLLVGYENKPQVFGHFGPATRDYAQKLLKQEIDKDKMEQISMQEQNSEDVLLEVPNSDPLVASLYKLEKRFSSRESFRNIINLFSQKLDEKIEDSNISIKKKFVFQKIQTAILTYLNETE